MADPIATMLAILTTILLMVGWQVITGSLPGEVGFAVNFMALVASVIVGLVVYLTFARN
ncbi:hypothetical protein [Natrialba sp. SSL1]|uniref:hypothetical protein n=1 Tax=Natrialba sp. SSL1 TaxID=1869245 RepID=UPI0014959CDA|nr:hypothetical protein [Natrialba sp. SSL1]